MRQEFRHRRRTGNQTKKFMKAWKELLVVKKGLKRSKVMASWLLTIALRERGMALKMRLVNTRTATFLARTPSLLTFICVLEFLTTM